MQVKLPGEAGDVGFKQAMQQKWISMDKSSGVPMIVRKVHLLAIAYSCPSMLCEKA